MVMTRAVPTVVSAALLLVGLPAPAAHAGPAVSILSPTEDERPVAGRAFDVTASVDSSVVKVQVTATSCEVAEPVVVVEPGQPTVTVTVACPVTTLTKTVSVRAVTASGSYTIASRFVTFTPRPAGQLVTTLDVAVHGVCTKQVDLLARVTDAEGQPVYGVPVTFTTASTQSSYFRPAGLPALVHGRTDLAGEATVTVAQAEFFQAAVQSLDAGLLTGGSAVPVGLPVETCRTVTTVTSDLPERVVYGESVTVSGRVELRRDSDGALVPFAGARVIGAGSSAGVQVRASSQGEWTVTFPVGGYAAAARITTHEPGWALSPSAQLTLPIEVVPYEGVLDASVPSDLRVGDKLTVPVVLTARHPDSGLTDRSLVGGKFVVDRFTFAGTHVSVSSQAAGAWYARMTPSSGKVTYAGVAVGNGELSFHSRAGYGDVAAAATTASVQAKARLKLSLSASSVAAGSVVKLRVAAAPMAQGTVDVEYRTSSSAAWQPWDSVPVNTVHVVTAPAVAGVYELRATVPDTVSALAASSNAVKLLVSSGPAGRATVTDLWCRYADTQPVCEWGTPVTAPGQEVTGYTVRVGGISLADIADPQARSFAVPETVLVSGVVTPLYKVGQAMAVRVTPKVSSGSSSAGVAKFTALAPVRGCNAIDAPMRTPERYEGQVVRFNEEAVAVPPFKTPLYVDSTRGPLWGTEERAYVTDNGDRVTTCPARVLWGGNSSDMADGQVRNVMVEARDGRLNLEWEPPIVLPSDRPSEYVVRYRLVGQAGQGWTEAGRTSATDFSVGGLVNGQQYELRVVPSSSLGEQPAISYLAAPTAQPKSLVSFRVDPVYHGLHVAWTDGGSGASGRYLVFIRYRPVGSASWSTRSWSLRTNTSVSGRSVADAGVTLSGLTPGVTYEVEAAVGDYGLGLWSSASASPSAQVTVPAPVTQLAAGSGYVPTWGGRYAGVGSLSWVKAEDGGSPVTGYVVQWKASSASVWNTVAVTPEPRFDGSWESHQRVQVPGPQNWGVYDYRVAAVNAAGRGPWSTVWNWQQWYCPLLVN